jgi:hypothetical protein
MRTTLRIAKLVVQTLSNSPTTRDKGGIVKSGSLVRILIASTP